MQIDGDTLILEADMTPEEVSDVARFIRSNINSIEGLEVNAPFEEWNSSVLLSLLVSAKKTKPTLHIPVLEEREINNSLFGTLNWICHE